MNLEFKDENDSIIDEITSEDAASEPDNISIESARSRTGKLIKMAIVKPIHRSDCGTMEILINSNPDIEEAFRFCSAAKIDLSPVTARLEGEMTAEYFFEILRDYMFALELRLDKGKMCDPNVKIAHPDKQFISAVSKYANSISEEERIINIEFIARFRRWIQQKYSFVYNAKRP
jgi:hypothetical protein